MAYNKRNLLEKMVQIQDITLEHTKRGVKQEWVYINVIYPGFKISRGTYYKYLAHNAKAELKRLATGEPAGEIAKNQMKLF
jgi:hypothetical protein